MGRHSTAAGTIYARELLGVVVAFFCMLSEHKSGSKRLLHELYTVLILKAYNNKLIYLNPV